MLAHTGSARGRTCYLGYPSLLTTHKACTGPYLLPRVALTAGYTDGCKGYYLLPWVALTAGSHRACMGSHLLSRVALTAYYTRAARGITCCSSPLATHRDRAGLHLLPWLASLLVIYGVCTGPRLLPKVSLTAGYIGAAWGITYYLGYSSLVATQMGCVGPRLLPRVVRLIIEVRRYKETFNIVQAETSGSRK